MSARTPIGFALAAALTLPGCVAGDGFPSLAPRPAERDLSTEEPARPRLAVPDDAALRGRITQLRVEAAEGERAFEGAWPAAVSAVASAGPRQSERWIEAQQSLSRLEAARAATTRVNAELDQLALSRAEQATSDADFTLIGETLAAVEGQVARQQERLEGLRARLSGR